MAITSDAVFLADTTVDTDVLRFISIVLLEIVLFVFTFIFTNDAEIEVLASFTSKARSSDVLFSTTAAFYVTMYCLTSIKFVKNMAIVVLFGFLARFAKVEVLAGLTSKTIPVNVFFTTFIASNKVMFIHPLFIT